jgi:hypothetical protein
LSTTANDALISAWRMAFDVDRREPLVFTPFAPAEVEPTG